MDGLKRQHHNGGWGSPIQPGHYRQDEKRHNDCINQVPSFCPGKMTSWLAGSARGVYGRNVEEIAAYVEDMRRGWMKDI